MCILRIFKCVLLLYIKWKIDFYLEFCRELEIVYYLVSFLLLDTLFPSFISYINLLE